MYLRYKYLLSKDELLFHFIKKQYNENSNNHILILLLLLLMNLHSDNKSLFVQMDPAYEPPESETRTLFGLKLQQLRNNATINKSVFSNIASKRKEVSIHTILKVGRRSAIK